ncbi:hypothetical protein [Enterococcus sp. DIV1420a]|uniref:hypothetical protein n=1 Tax=Enterococcus sp. DIV1420a TaxID=2774672 RepID=UPI003F284ED8
MSELNQLISFLEEQLTVSEPTPDYTRHNQEIITYIEYLKSMKQLQLNENQQIVLEQLCLIYTKQIYKSSLQAIYIFIKNGMSDAYLNLYRKEASQVLEVFAKWAQEQEEG